jgi:hypothetical protein
MLFVATEGVKYIVRAPRNRGPVFVLIEGEGRKIRFNAGTETTLTLLAPDFVRLESELPGVSIWPERIGLPVGVRVMAVEVAERSDDEPVVDAAPEPDATQPEPTPKPPRKKRTAEA